MSTPVDWNRGPRLYLDVDGVLNAQALMWADSTRAVVTVDTPGGDERYLITYSPAQLSAIDELRDDFGLELVWLTTWLEDDGVDELVKTLRALDGGRRLSIPRRLVSAWSAAGELPYLWKREQILQDLAADPGPFIWADDDEVPVHGTFVAEAFDVSSLMLAPNRELGLTRKHLLAMREFLTRWSAAQPR